MVRRCSDPKNDPHKLYFHRGIEVYPEWTIRGTRGGRAVWSPGFVAWLDYMEETLGACPIGHQMDRINNSIGYQPGNLRWNDATGQMVNRRHYIRKLDNPTGYKWVQKTRSGRYEGCFSVKGKCHYIGTHETAEKAYEAVINQRLSLGLQVPNINMLG